MFRFRSLDSRSIHICAHNTVFILSWQFTFHSLRLDRRESALVELLRTYACVYLSFYLNYYLLPTNPHLCHILAPILTNVLFTCSFVYLLYLWPAMRCVTRQCRDINCCGFTTGECLFDKANFLTPWCRVLLEKLTGLQLVKKFPAFHETRRFITALTSVRQLSVSWASPIQSIHPHFTSWRSILILSTNLRLDLPCGIFPSGFPTKTLYTPLSSPIRATCPAYLILLDFITRTILGEGYKSFSTSLWNRLHSPVISSLLGPCVPIIPYLYLYLYHPLTEPRVFEYM